MTRYPSKVYLRSQLIEHGIRGWLFPHEKNKNFIILNTYCSWKTEKEVFDFFESICCKVSEVKFAVDGANPGYVKLKGNNDEFIR